MRKIFISYHHKREQKEKDRLVKLIKNSYSEYFEVKDMSVQLGDIHPMLPAKKIYKIIREEYLKDTDVTIVILGKHTKCRKHIDWEIVASLISYGSLGRRKKNGLLILLTDDFIKKQKINKFFNGKNYNTLITKKNSSPRIYKNVINNYAVVDSFLNVISNVAKLKALINEAQDKSKIIALASNNIFKKEDLIKEERLFENDKEECPKKSKKYIENCLYSTPCYSKRLERSILNFDEVKPKINSLDNKNDNNIFNFKHKDDIRDWCADDNMRCLTLLLNYCLI